MEPQCDSPGARRSPPAVRTRAQSALINDDTTCARGCAHLFQEYSVIRSRWWAVALMLLAAITAQAQTRTLTGSVLEVTGGL